MRPLGIGDEEAESVWASSPVFDEVSRSIEPSMREARDDLGRARADGRSEGVQHCQGACAAIASEHDPVGAEFRADAREDGRVAGDGEPCGAVEQESGDATAGVVGGGGGSHLSDYDDSPTEVCEGVRPHMGRRGVQHGAHLGERETVDPGQG